MRISSGVASRLHDVGMVVGDRRHPAQAGPADARRAARDAGPRGARQRDARGLRTTICSTSRRRSPARTTSASTAAATRAATPASEIPLVGRIVAVADTFDALTTDRVYRQAMSVEEAVEMLRAERGHQFDPAGRRRVPRRRSTRRWRSASASRPPRRAFRGGSRSAAEEDTQVTLQAAANALAISPSRLRRWADEGRIPIVRTAGGHRRFPLQAVRRLAAERGVRPSVRPVEPPAVAAAATRGGAARARPRRWPAAAAAAIYRDGPAGLVRRGDRRARPARVARRRSSRAARPAATPARSQATEALMRRAHLHAATPARAPRVPRALRPGRGALARRARGGAHE